MKMTAKSAVALVALALITIAAGSGYAYWRMRPQPLPAQVIYGSGRIEADEVRVAVEVPGRLLENRAVEGKSMTAGEPLARIDAADYELQQDRIAAQHEAVRRTRAQITAQIGLAEHHAGSARKDLDRYETLGSEGWVPAKRVESARDAYAAANEQTGVLREQGAEAAAQDAAVAKTHALARSQIAKTRVAAPITGAVLDRLAEPGEVVAAGQPVAVLADLTEVKLKVFVSERDLGKVRLGAPARIRIDAFPGRDFPAQVAHIDAQAQFTPRDVHMADERSRTVYGVILAAANPDGLLKPGMPADSWILWDEKTGWPATLRVPE